MVEELLENVVAERQFSGMTMELLEDVLLNVVEEKKSKPVKLAQEKEQEGEGEESQPVKLVKKKEKKQQDHKKKGFKDVVKRQQTTLAEERD